MFILFHNIFLFILLNSPPTSIHLKPMNPDVDAKIADDVWPNKHDGSLFFLKRLIELNPNIGAYNENNELVAWCFR